MYTNTQALITSKISSLKKLFQKNYAYWFKYVTKEGLMSCPQKCTVTLVVTKSIKTQYNGNPMYTGSPCSLALL